MGDSLAIQPAQSWERPATSNSVYRFRLFDANDAAVPANATVTVEWLSDSSSGEQGPATVQRIFLLPGEGGWSGVHTAPQRTSGMRVRLYYWTQLGQKPARTWELTVEPAEIPKPRAWNLAVAHQALRYPASLESNVAICLETIRQAGECKIDLLCLSENFVDRNVALPLRERAMGFDHPLVRALCDAARQARLHLVFSFHEQSPEGAVYNCAPLIGPDGQVVGKYRKHVLTQGELEAGMTPADGGYPVFDTPLGRVGILICYDMWYPETAVELANNGAEIICHPLAGDTLPAHWDHCWRARALDHQVFLLNSVTADCGGEAPSRILGPDGQVLAHTREPNNLATATVRLPCDQKLDWLSGGPYDAVIRNAMAEARLKLRNRSGGCRALNQE